MKAFTESIVDEATLTWLGLGILQDVTRCTHNFHLQYEPYAYPFNKKVPEADA